MNLLDKQSRPMDQGPRAFMRGYPLLRADCLLSSFATVTPVRGPWTAAIVSSFGANYGKVDLAQSSLFQFL